MSQLQYPISKFIIYLFYNFGKNDLNSDLVILNFTLVFGGEFRMGGKSPILILQALGEEVTSIGCDRRRSY